jgi:hypothetical protein
VSHNTNDNQSQHYIGNNINSRQLNSQKYSKGNDYEYSQDQYIDKSKASKNNQLINSNNNSNSQIFKIDGQHSGNFRNSEIKGSGQINHNEIDMQKTNSTSKIKANSRSPTFMPSINNSNHDIIANQNV